MTLTAPVSTDTAGPEAKKIEKKSNVEDASCVLRSVSSCTAITDASEEFFSALTEFIAERGDHGADRLRRDHPPHQNRRRHAERLARGHLPAIDAEHARAQHLSDEWRFVAGKRQPGSDNRRQFDAYMRQRIVGEDHLQDQRRAAEDHGVGPSDGRQQPETG